MSFAGSRPVEAANVVEDTWEKLGHRLRPIGMQICVRTQIPKRITAGGIILTEKSSDFYAGLPNVDLSHKPGGTRMVTGTVCSFGEKVQLVEIGEVIYFPRGFFARYKKLDDGSFVGWIREENVWAVFDPEEEEGDEDDHGGDSGADAG